VSLFNIVKNKEIVGYSGEETLMLGDIARLLGHELNRDEHLSDVSCLTCDRSYAIGKACTSGYTSACTRINYSEITAFSGFRKHGQGKYFTA